MSHVKRGVSNAEWKHCVATDAIHSTKYNENGMMASKDKLERMCKEQL
jgi:hypothetical protein